MTRLRNLHDALGVVALLIGMGAMLYAVGAGPGSAHKAAVTNDHETAMLARWDAELAIAELK